MLAKRETLLLVWLVSMASQTKKEIESIFVHKRVRESGISFLMHEGKDKITSHMRVASFLFIYRQWCIWGSFFFHVLFTEDHYRRVDGRTNREICWPLIFSTHATGNCMFDQQETPLMFCMKIAFIKSTIYAIYNITRKSAIRRGYFYRLGLRSSHNLSYPTLLLVCFVAFSQDVFVLEIFIMLLLAKRANFWTKLRLVDLFIKTVFNTRQT